MNRICKYALFIILTGVINLHSIGQQSSTIIPPSPDAAALGVHGSIPVSTYTGIPSVNIPLYNISYKDIQIPIDLSYHGSGVLVEQDASWVGLGWTLNVGGVITRTMRYGDDMQSCNDGYSQYGTYNSKGYPVDNQNETSGTWQADICNRQIDPEPDIFYFNFLGKSGSFVLESGQSLSANFLQATPLNVEKIDIKYDKVNLRWVIRTTNGYTFYFGTKEITETVPGGGYSGEGPESINFPSNSQLSEMMSASDNTIVSAWYLDKIITPLGEEVSYVYDSKTPNTSNSYYLYGSARISITEASQKLLIDPGNQGQCYIPPSQTSAAKTFTFHAYLKEINHPLGKIIFNKSSRDDMIPATVSGSSLPYLAQGPAFYMTWAQYGAQKLDNIIMLDNSGAILKKFELSYDYFNAAYTGENKYNYKRLKLDKVRECNQQNCKPYYQLFYNETYPLPSKYSKAQDFWGYYNGANNNISRIPFGTYFDSWTNKYYHLGDSNRQPNGEYMTAGILNKIIYPTGGSTELEFEPHDYFTFSSDAFTLTDFVNNTPVSITTLGTNGNDPNPFQIVNFTLTDPLTEVTLDETMTYYPANNAGDPCSVTDPGIYYVGNETWYSLQNTSTSAIVNSRYMSDYLNYFISNHNNHCLNTPYTPQEIDPIFRRKQTFMLNAGTYQLKVYTRSQFGLQVDVTKNVMPSRTITQNGNGVYAKTAGGLRIKRIITKEYPTAVAQIKKYNYTTTVNSEKYSTGKLLLDPRYHVPFYCEIPSQGALIAILGRSWSNSPLGTSGSGSIVGYDEVTELNGENAENGKTEYYYANQIEQATGFPTQIEGFPTVKRTSNGLLSDLKHFTGAGIIVSSENYEYTHQLTKEIKGTASQHMLQRTSGSSGFVVVSGCNPRVMAIEPYYIISDRWAPTKKTSRAYAQNSANYLQTITESEFDIQTHLQLKSEQTTSSNGDVIKNVYSYPSDASWIPVAMWQDKFMYDKIVKKELFRNNNIKDTYKAFYTAGANSFLLNKEEASKGTTTLEQVNTYNYFINGNIKEVLGRDGINQIYLWGYKNSYPVAQIKNATLTEVLSAMGNISEASLNLLAAENNPSTDYLNKISILRPSLPEAFVTTYSYRPLVGISSETGPNGKTIYYEYDNFNRLQLIRDKDNNIVKRICYNYYGQIEDCNVSVFGNQLQSASFIRECSPGYSGSSVTYTVAANTYSASTLAAANLLATNDVNANGQAYANANGTCTLGTIYWNTSMFQFFTRNNCPPGYTPGIKKYIVPANTYSSTISPQDAQAQAQADIDANGQNYANANGTCTPPSGCNSSNCTGEAYKCINDNCELGYRVNTNTIYHENTGQWECVYHYEFSDGSWSQNYSSFGSSPCYNN